MTRHHSDSRGSDDETKSYSPMKHTRLVSDGSQFFEVPTRPSSPQYFFVFSRDPEMDAISASLVATNSTPAHPFQNPATTTLRTAPTASPSSPFPPPSSTLTTGTHGEQQDMSQDTARTVIRAYILASAWFQADEMEPRADGTGVPECALLLANPGESIWACFFKKTRRNGTTIFKCTDCNRKTDRWHRAVEHQRAKWGHEPFACTDHGWYEAGTTVGNRFFC